MTSSYILILDNLDKFKLFLINEYTYTSNNLIENYFTDLNKYIKIEMNKNLEFFLEASLNSSVNSAEIDNFIIIYKQMLLISNNYFTKINLTSNSIFSKFENEFVFQFFETKEELIKSSLEKEDWNPQLNIPLKLQSITKFLIEENYIELKFKDLEILNLNLNKINHMKETIKISENEINPPTTNNNQFLDLQGINFKITNCTQDIVNFIFDSIKVIIYFDINLSETIIYQFVKIMKIYMGLCREIIIEGEGVKKGKLKSISQKEISMLCSNVCIVENIILQVIKNFSTHFMEEKQEIIIPSLNELLLVAKKLHISCRDKISELFQYTIGSSLEELSKLDFVKYPILPAKEHNAYCNRFKSFKTLYNHMLNAFEKEEIISIFNENLKVYFEKLEKGIMSSLNGSKVENDASFKQLKSDLLFFKKSLKAFELFDTNIYKDKIDAIMNNVLPAKLLKKKKTINTSSKNVVITDEN